MLVDVTPQGISSDEAHWKPNHTGASYTSYFTVMKRVFLVSARQLKVSSQRFVSTVHVDHTKFTPKKEALEAVKVNTTANVIAGKAEAAAPSSKCGPEDDPDDLDEMEEMFIQGPAGMEWNGPTRGGKRPEPTRFGDWERKGRASDF